MGRSACWNLCDWKVGDASWCLVNVGTFGMSFLPGSMKHPMYSVTYFFIFLIYIVYTFLIFCGYLQGTILWFSIGILDSQFIIFEVWSRSSVIKLFRKWRSCDSASRESFFFDWVKEMWCFERVKICKNQFIDFVVPTSMRGTWLAKTNNFRCCWGSSEKNWKQRLHFESFVPQFSSESSRFPGVPCHILMCCASRQRFYITSLWSYPLSSVMRVTCRRESPLILLTTCWLIPSFININRQQLCE